MEAEYINSSLFTLHVILLGVKVFAVYIIYNWFKVSKSLNKDKYLFVYIPMQIFLFLFGCLFIVSEIYFILNFYKDIDLYYYEYLAILDEIIFTLIGITYFSKRKENG